MLVRRLDSKFKSPSLYHVKYFILWSMSKSTDLRRGRTCVFALHIHLVFVAKFRRKVFTKEILIQTREIFKSVCRDFEAELMEFEGERDHVHLLVNYPPKVSVSKLVNSLKGVSARLLRKKGYPTIVKYLWGRSLWSPSYFAGSCGGAPISIRLLSKLTGPAPSCKSQRLN